MLLVKYPELLDIDYVILAAIVNIIIINSKYYSTNEF